MIFLAPPDCYDGLYYHRRCPLPSGSGARGPTYLGRQPYTPAPTWNPAGTDTHRCPEVHINNNDMPYPKDVHIPCLLPGHFSSSVSKGKLRPEMVWGLPGCLKSQGSQASMWHLFLCARPRQ